MIVTIPRIANHYDTLYKTMTVEISDKCPKCGKKRGIKRSKGFSFDGRHRIVVDIWENECGHVDTYCDVRKEIKNKNLI